MDQFDITLLPDSTFEHSNTTIANYKGILFQAIRIFYRHKNRFSLLNSPI